ncbi:transcription factor E2F/dimerization partner [Ancylostoma caninum]|uniref:Transcription factor E2F/dimerization partner n=1 Tax=Ancylostoma caninum TaxID=29170 RepID=A0A368H156_ANCCA|nr:transcription factor E2F/dimerization partner [Ancylostoma caninum]
MSQWAAMLEANKENIPYPLDVVVPKPTVSEVRETVLPEIGVDVTTVAHPVLPSSPLSQKSNISVQSQGSASDSPHVFSMAASSRRESSDELDVESEDGEVTSRKEKSLGLLCQRFLIAMNEETRTSMSREVHLETVARKMNVEKRRIYDIVNVMEALDAMSKTNKSYYRWHGLEGLPKLMADLQKEAVEERLPERVLRVEQAMCSFTELSPGSRKAGTKEIVGTLIGEDDASSSSNQSYDLSHSSQIHEKRSRVDGRDRQGRNSLAQLCRRFLMVLLSNPKNTRRVSLDVASTVLIKDPETEGFEPPSRSRCRRLYDIANVLVALGLIKKVHYLFGTKKIPLFVYCGPEPDENSKFDVNACIERLLASSASTPLTPQMKATTAAMQHSLSLGKRSNSEANLRVPVTHKMPRLKSEDFVSQASSSLMMFAELAAERLRQETELRQRASSGPAEVAGTSSSAKESTVPLVRSNSGHTLPRPQAQRSFGNFSVSPLSSPMTGARRYTVKVGNSYHMSSLPLAGLQPIVLPTTPVWTPAAFPDFMRSPAGLARTSGPLIPQPTNKVPVVQQAKPAVKHAVTNILGVSNKVNIDPLNHRNSSPFQVVKKDNNIP